MDIGHFENGVRSSPIMAAIYDSLPQDLTRAWGEVSSSSFFSWLNAASEKHAGGQPPITNLAAWLYDKRVDLQKVYPGLQGSTRIAFIQWSLIHAQKEYDLDDQFVAPMQKAALAWAVAPSPADSLGGKGVPLVTNLGAYLHATQPNLQRPYPDIYGENRVDFAVWYLYHAELERCAQRDLILPVVQSWARACISKR